MKDLNKTMRKCYELLENRETTLKSELSKEYIIQSQDIQNVVASVYQVATVGDKLDYTRLLSKISKPSAIQIEREVRWVNGLFPNENVFGDLAFDQLNRLQLAHVQFVCIELRTAATTRDRVRKHLKDYILACIDIYYQDFLDEILYYPDKVKLIDTVIDDKVYPYGQSLYQDAINCAERLSAMLKNEILKGTQLMGNLGAIALLTSFACRKEMTDLELILKSQGTRVTVQLVGEMFPSKSDVTTAEQAPIVNTKSKKKSYIKYFRSKTADANACEFCFDIEREQKKNPVPFEELKPWYTAPPFHPRCRCGIEVIWSDDKDNEK